MRVQVSLSARDLGNIAPGRWRGKKSHPYATVSLAGSGDGGGGGGEGAVVGRTEV